MAVGPAAEHRARASMPAEIRNAALIQCAPAELVESERRYDGNDSE